MSPPTHTDEIFLSSNPLAKRKINNYLARTQWDLFYKILSDRLGLNVELIPPSKECPDAVLTGIAGISFRKTFYKSFFPTSQQRFESLYSCLSENYPVKAFAANITFLGHKDIVPALDSILILGYRQHSELAQHEALANEIPSAKILSLQIVDDRLHFLDNMLTVLGENEVMFYRGLFSRPSESSLMGTFKNTLIYRLDDVNKHYCSSLVIGKNILCTNFFKEGDILLRSLGYQIMKVDISEFEKLGYNLNSLILSLNS